LPGKKCVSSDSSSLIDGFDMKIEGASKRDHYFRRKFKEAKYAPKSNLWGL
jgi:hypothetical protein